MHNSEYCQFDGYKFIQVCIFKLTNTGKVYHVLCLYLIKNATEPAKQSNSTGIEIVFKKVNITVLAWNGNSKQGQGSQGEC